MSDMTRESDLPTVGPRGSIHNDDSAGQMVGPADSLGDTPNVNTESHNSGDVDVNH